ncbi:MAG: multidrug transporter subunit MdtJ [Desulfobacterales bacterium]|nr:multidrug transporter subunit MdtJ [Desulfobacterales bacterium]
MYYWFFMFLAIITEVAGTLTMKYGSETGNYLGLAIMFVMITASYWFLSIAIKKIPLAVAYGTWESIGLVLIAVFSFFLFGENLGILKILAIALVISGIVLMERNTISPDEEEGGMRHV